MASGTKYRGRPPVRPTDCLTFRTSFTARSPLTDGRQTVYLRHQFSLCVTFAKYRILVLDFFLQPTNGNGG